MKKVVFNLMMWLGCALPTLAQTGMVEYSKEFEFKEGIYPTYKNFLYNNPIPKSKIITELNRDDIDFMPQLTSQKIIKYQDSAGVEQSIKPEKLWGYSKNNGVFIYFSGDFNRIAVIGSLCHFTASVIDYIARPGIGIGMGGMGMSTMVTRELKQFIIDTKSGLTYEFTTARLEYLLQADPELLQEFISLKKREKRESTFLYLRKYNQKHPLYFPAN